MQSNAKKTYYFQADANSLGGFIEKPFHQIIPSQASVSLPPVGGHAASRTHAFRFEEIVSCRSAYVRVSGSQSAPDGPWSTTVTSVVEGLNILEVITAERLVAQISVKKPRLDAPIEVSIAGTSFEQLRLGGCEVSPALNASLLCGARSRLDLPVFRKTGKEQAGRMMRSIEEGDNREDFRWVFDRFGWMAREPEEDSCVLCSLVDGLNGGFPGTAFGHAVEIPDFGRIFLGELVVCAKSVQLSMVRAELGCGTAGSVSAASSAVRGGTIPP